MQASMVPAEHAWRVWPDIREYMEGAAEYTFGRYTADDIYECVMEKDHTLWIAFDEAFIHGAVVTYIATYPRARYVVMAFAGGADGVMWKDPMLTILQKWAFDNGCTGIEATARLGWSRIFKHNEYKPIWQTFELPAGAAGIGADNG